MSWLNFDYFKYNQVAQEDDGNADGSGNPTPSTRTKSRYTAMFLIAVFSLLLAWFVSAGLESQSPQDCDTISNGYICNPSFSHQFGQYSPYYRVPSSIPDAVPKGCRVTFANVLSRHGARSPTLGSSVRYAAFVKQLQTAVTSFKGKYSFIKTYEYKLGADELTEFGQQQMVNSGIKFFRRYEELTDSPTLFIRSTAASRVIASATNFSQGYHSSLLESGRNTTSSLPYSILVLPYDSNNTLSNDACVAASSKPGSLAQAEWARVFTPAIATRLDADLPGMNFSASDVVTFMDLCPFDTVASRTGALSPFCLLFTTDEWKNYDYYESLGKFYGYGPGNALAPTLGVGFVNELIARLTNSPVDDHTSVNNTLDSNTTTFPIDKEHKLFADFSHDNDMTGILSALGLYNHTSLLSNDTYEDAKQTHGYSAAWTVPFAARIYFEKLQCGVREEEKVRILVNDRVMPLVNCGRDELGMCALSSFVESLSFARSGGKWSECFKGIS